MDFCGKSSGLADFENTVGRGSAVIFGADSGLCLSYVRVLGPKRNLDHRSFFSLGRNVNEFNQIISFFLGVRLLSELCCVVAIELVAFFTVCVKVTVAFIHLHLHIFKTFTLLFPDVVVVSDLNKNFGGSTDFAKKGIDRRI